MNITTNTSLTELFEIVKVSLNELNSGEIFIVKDLFRGFEWNRISKGNRTKLGSMVFNFANHEGSTIIDSIGKTPQNQQKYKKI
ncbi:DUF1413 domain-containing protein [Clostridium perfringens]|uniref:DUF1413 domain-containing protein n=1 Tax=Clostridium perfringens TaxID=1502 RepID=UPI0003FD3834|nr:DUF1413 domain-containing protein [Clostridium perfringens]EJT6478469.1 single-stranded DNA-binding protein [Clostridium perfringens]